MKPFTFKSVKKIPWPVELPDGRKITLQPCPWEDMLAMRDIDMDDLAKISKLVAKLLSYNLEKEIVSVNFVNTMFDAGDIKEFMTEYATYIHGQMNQKN